MQHQYLSPPAIFRADRQGCQNMDCVLRLCSERQLTSIHSHSHNHDHVFRILAPSQGILFLYIYHCDSRSCQAGFRKGCRQQQHCAAYSPLGPNINPQNLEVSTVVSVPTNFLRRIIPTSDFQFQPQPQSRHQARPFVFLNESSTKPFYCRSRPDPRHDSYLWSPRAIWRSYHRAIACRAH